MLRKTIAQVLWTLLVISVLFSTEAFSQSDSAQAMRRAEESTKETIRISKEMRKRNQADKKVLDLIDLASKRAEGACKKVREKARDKKIKRDDYKLIVSGCRESLEGLWSAIRKVNARAHRDVLQDAFEPGLFTLRDLKRAGY